MQSHRVVPHTEWLAARADFLAKEKEFTRLRDELSQQRRNLPWERVDKDYNFSGPHGNLRFIDLFAGRSQLIVYHFMFDPSWEAGCVSCSFWADNFNGIGQHLAQRDVTLVAISRAPLAKLQTFQQRMGWNFPWFSAGESDFNYDYQVSFRPEEVAQGRTIYNYQPTTADGERPGISVFYRDEQGVIYHTYSCYARGLDLLNGAYHYLDLTPKGRAEADLPWPMAWLRYHDSYGPQSIVVS